MEYARIVKQENTVRSVVTRKSLVQLVINALQIPLHRHCVPLEHIKLILVNQIVLAAQEDLHATASRKKYVQLAILVATPQFLQFLVLKDNIKIKPVKLVAPLELLDFIVLLAPFNAISVLLVLFARTG